MDVDPTDVSAEPVNGIQWSASVTPPGRRQPLRAVALIVLDSVGIGGAPDAAAFGDEGSATLQHVAEAVGGLRLPNLQKAGLGNIVSVAGVAPADSPSGSYGSMVEVSPGKDTTTGHWELTGVILDRAFPTYPHGFPPDVMDAFSDEVGRGWLGNVAASGTEIIERLGAEHIHTGQPIVYTSADSVFQIAAHVDVIPLEDLYEMCRQARRIMRGPHEVGRVIARPFRGTPGGFERTPDRHDFSVVPPSETVLDEISAAGLEVRGVGKISDIFAGRGVTSSRPTHSNHEGAGRGRRDGRYPAGPGIRQPRRLRSGLRPPQRRRGARLLSRTSTWLCRRSWPPWDLETPSSSPRITGTTRRHRPPTTRGNGSRFWRWARR